MSSPPAKRQRTEDAPPTRSSTWRSDGNVVLQAGNTQYRVHWSVLALHSPVFHDMHGLPQPAEQATVEGCPVVELPDDPQDVEHLLTALYTPTFLSQEKISFSAVAALVRLGKKYEFKDLFDSVVGRLASEIPMTLQAYDAMEGEYLAIESYLGLNLDILILASENNLFTILPCVYFFATDELFEGITRTDGTTVCLPPSLLRKCIVAQQNLVLKQSQLDYTFGWAFDGVFDGCMAKVKCMEARTEFLGHFLPSGFYGFLEPSHIKFYGFCSSCAGYAKKRLIAGRQKLWDELPDVFGLPPWNELKNEY
ncbi:BTB domain-containing protein [Favolaschia claudopus]|uniref:BTB domain-containing protein n=1 Tax=Favolaschia claudopus TaxID=2862362 RepID=A0AAW0BFQ5_9AGAR